MLIDISHAAIPAHHPLPKIIEDCGEYWQETVEGLVFPAWGHRGPNFNSSVFCKPPLPDELIGKDFPETDVISVLKFCSERNLEFWLALNVTLPFVRSGAAHVKDNLNRSSPQCCIVSPATLQALELCLQDLAKECQAANLGIQKIVIPTQDLWGMSAGQGEIALTCFCRNCQNWLSAHNIDVQYLLANPRIWQLLLADTGDAISPADNITRATTAGDVVAWSEGQTFYAFKELDQLRKERATRQEIVYRRRELETDAQKLLDYTHKASDMTGEYLVKYIAACKRLLGITTAAVVADASPYDWTSRMYFEDFDLADLRDRVTALDVTWEVWHEPSNEVAMLTRTPHRLYLHARARYLLDAFAERLDDAVNPITAGTTALSRERARSELRDRALKSRVSLLTAADGRIAERNQNTKGCVGSVLCLRGLIDVLCRAAYPDWDTKKPEVAPDLQEFFRAVTQSRQED